MVIPGLQPLLGWTEDVERGLKGLADYNYFWWGQRLGDGRQLSREF